MARKSHPSCPPSCTWGDIRVVVGGSVRRRVALVLIKRMVLSVSTKGVVRAILLVCVSRLEAMVCAVVTNSSGVIVILSFCNSLMRLGARCVFKGGCCLWFRSL